MKTSTTILFVNLLFTNVIAQINNAGFEIWDTTFAASYEYELINEYQVPNPVSGEIYKWTASVPAGICQTTDAYEGTYAVIIHNWYNHVIQDLNYSDTITSRPNYLSGYYKYNGTVYNDMLSKGIASIVITNSNADTIANTTYNFDTTSNYQLFEIPIEYLLSDEPDSIFISFKSGDQPCISSPICNLLYLDEIKFSQNSALSVNEDVKQSVEIYPNPTKNTIAIVPFAKGDQITILNTSGQYILKSSNTNQINIGSFQPGIYFVQIKNAKEELLCTKKIIKR